MHMAKALTIASWNVEHFKNNPERIEVVVKYLEAQAPDVFGLYEVKSSDVYSTLVNRMPNYQFHITEGAPDAGDPRRGEADPHGSFTQQIEFKSGNTYLRPGALLTSHLGNEEYPFLFLPT